MKKIVALIFLLFISNGIAQTTKMFAKEPIINLENWQKKRLYFGYYLGFNSYDYNIKYKKNEPEILVNTSIGYNVGVVADLRLHEYINLRFEPGLYYTKRDLNFPSTPSNLSDTLREVNGTNIHFPLLLKFSSLRTGNVRPYLLGGASATLNLSSNAKSLEDNLEKKFRVQTWTTNYEVGFGIDIFSEYFIFSPSVRGVFGINDELLRDNDPNSPWTGNIESMKTRALFVNFTFH